MWLFQLFSYEGVLGNQKNKAILPRHGVRQAEGYKPIHAKYPSLALKADRGISRTFFGLRYPVLGEKGATS